MSLIRASLLLSAFALACSSTPDNPDKTPGQAAPTYSELYTSYFAPGTPGHCATAGCHADPAHTTWLCGASKGDCYAGMVSIGLIDLSNPTQSRIANVQRSDLVWVNPTSGSMPFDDQVANDKGRDAITAWVAAGAQDN